MTKIKVSIFLSLISFFLSSQTVLQTFSCTGMGYTYVVPNDVCLIKIKAWGAGGGKGGNDAFAGGNGGGGGYAEALVYVNPGDIITVFPGCGGTLGSSGGNAPGGTGEYGYGLGGNGGNSGPIGVSGAGGGGGGSSAVLIGTNVVVVAPGGAGGGGGGCTSAGGNGGGGGNNGSGTSCVGSFGIAGGNFVKDGADGPSHSGDGGGGGGGGGGFTNGGSAGSAPPNGPTCNAANDCGASGGGGGNGFALTSTGYPVVSSSTMSTNSHIPANASDPNLPSGFAYGGYSGNGGNGQSGYVVLIKMNTNPPPVANITYNQHLCEKDTLKLQGSGGITYLWTGPNSFTSAVSNPIISNVSNANSGYYTLLVQSVDGCVDAAIRNIIVKPLPPKPTSNSPLCEGRNLNLVGSGAISYTWINTNNGFVSNSSTISITNVTSNNAGNYYYFATGSNGCIRKDTINVIVNPNPNSVISSTNVSCNGFADGSALATPTIGTSPYFYLWDNGATSALINNLPPGTYTVRVTDANNCIAFATTTITEPSPISSTVFTKDLDCYNIPTGSATVQASGGVGSYSYTWFPGSYTGSVVTNIPAGNYNVQIKDANNCISTQTLSINQPSPISSTVVTKDLICNNIPTGSATVTANGGIGPYTYSWVPIGVATDVVSNLFAGNYTVEVRDANNCIYTKTLVINQPLPITSTVNTQDLTCFNIPTGSATVIANGGTNPYNYLWIPGGNTTYIATNLSAGSYTVQITDANNCVHTQTVLINQPSQISSTISIQDLVCNNIPTGQSTVYVSGGTSPYSYSWLPTLQTSSVLSNVSAGTYTIQVMDANNCIHTKTFVITQPPPISATVNTKDLDCYNIPTGSATVIANGGTSPYTFTWMPVGQTGPSANNLSAGNYIVQIKDANNCSYSQTFTINQPTQLQGNIQFTPVTCWGGTDGAVNVMAYGGTAPYSYLWLPININNSFANNLSAGIYTLNLTDVKNCIFTQTVQVTEPPPVMLSVSPSQTICFGQSANIYAFTNGGIPPYTYTWSVPGLISTGPHNVSPTSTTIYSVIAQDANGCVSLPQTIAINVLPPLSGNNATITACDKDTVVLSFTLSSPGNGGPYSYNWQNGTYTPTLLTVADFNTNPNTFNVVVSDGCTVSDATVAITLSVHPLPKGYFITDKKSGCEPLSITYTPISNGTNDQYLWHFEDGTNSTSVTPTITYTTGIYSATLHITDQYGCQIDTVSVKDVTVFPKPVADFVPIPSVVSNIEPIVTFNNLSIGGTFYQWNFNDPYSNANLSNEVNPIHYYEKPGEYEVALFVMNEFDYRDSVYKTIKVGYDFTVFIPNVFTPDGDGLNDIFNVKGIGISDKDFLLRIFNRWGHLIYETEDITKGWDGFFNGKICEDGQYIYYIQLKLEKSDRKNDIRIFKGNVFLFNKQKAPEY